MKKANELKNICDLLEGYKDDNRYEVLSAQKEDGKWVLTIQKMEPVQEEAPKETADDNQ